MLGTPGQGCLRASKACIRAIFPHGEVAGSAPQLKATEPEYIPPTYAGPLIGQIVNTGDQSENSRTNVDRHTPQVWPAYPI